MEHNEFDFTEHEVHHDDGEGNWLISYADLMTLLWGFFVIISSLSTPDPAKVETLKKETSESMGGKYVVPYNEISDALKDVLKEMNIDHEVQIETLIDGVRITAQSAKFFDPGKATLKEEALPVVRKVGEILLEKGKGFIILVEGHTDDVPINNGLFSSNWDLSMKRATEVVHLFESLGVPHTDLRPVGLADIQPIVPVAGVSDKAALSEARSKNRRVVIRLQKKIAKIEVKESPESVVTTTVQESKETPAL